MLPVRPEHIFERHELLAVAPPPSFPGFFDFWRARYERATHLDPHAELHDTGESKAGFRIFDLAFASTDGVRLGGWLLQPEAGPPRRVVVVGHGYGGREVPDFDLPVTDAAFLFPCARGISRSPVAGVPCNPNHHVLYDIHLRDRYILGGCVEDIWMACSAAQALVPDARERLGFMGISFSGGLGMLAAACETRLKRVHIEVPTFGHHELRMMYPTHGSGHALQGFFKRHPNVLQTLKYFDAAIAARHVTMPVSVAAALCDPVVTPPGQFAIHNALANPAQLFVLDKGHSDYENQAIQRKELMASLATFFDPL